MPGERLLAAQKPELFEFLIANQKKYSIEHSNNLTNLVGRRVWGFTGIKPVLRLPLRTADGWQRDYSDDNPFV